MSGFTYFEMSELTADFCPMSHSQSTFGRVLMQIIIGVTGLPKNLRDPPMDALRYYLALFVIIAFPVAFSFWLSIHPFIRFRRRVGPGLTYGIHSTVVGLVAA